MSPASLSRSTRRRQAGALGLTFAARRTFGIDASATPEKTRAQIMRIARHTAEQVDLGRTIDEQDVTLDTRYGGPEYGLPNEGTLEAIRLCAQYEGMLNYSVYEGKSMHGMIDRVHRGEFEPGAKVLYAHLGGVPALSAYSFLFRNG
jgi:1-aminocyclopropane-1-carboxylate deaminase